MNSLKKSTRTLIKNYAKQSKFLGGNRGSEARKQSAFLIKDAKRIRGSAAMRKAHQSPYPN